MGKPASNYSGKWYFQNVVEFTKIDEEPPSTEYRGCVTRTLFEWNEFRDTNNIRTPLLWLSEFPDQFLSALIECKTEDEKIKVLSRELKFIFESIEDVRESLKIICDSHLAHPDVFSRAEFEDDHFFDTFTALLKLNAYFNSYRYWDDKEEKELAAITIKEAIAA